MEYTKIDERVTALLTDIVGSENIIIDTELLEPYTHDEAATTDVNPDVVVTVETAVQVSEIMKLALKERFPVTPRGAGQGLSGGSVPVCGGVVLSLEKMDKILEIDETNFFVTVEPGIITGNLHRAVEEKGLFYPPDPASLDSCSIGGNIAENAGGPRAVKYGVTHQYVCGLEAVLPSGEIINLGGKVVKDVTGYSLLQLLIGSEGTLAIITKILLRLIPLPKERIDLLVPFDNFTTAAETVAAVLKNRIVPAALEFMEQDSILAAEKLIEKEVPFHDAAAHLLITLDGNDAEALLAEAEQLGEMCLERGALEVLVADDSQLRDKLWDARRKIIEALQNLSPVHQMDTQDISVPRSELPEALAKIKKVAEKYGLQIISFGHSGDGNIHVNIIKTLPVEEWEKKAPAAGEEIYRIAAEVGGKITGEHGIGITRKEFLGINLDPTTIELMKMIKDDFDPNGILNPGKIFSN
jgi:glycolate oxidase